MSVKNEVLKQLERMRGRAVSGQELADGIGVSRAAVWKAVRALKAEGYEISGVSNKGYALAEDNDILSAEGIGLYLESGLEIFVHKEIDSTNSEAKRLVADGLKKPALIAADCQTAGRGRQGKYFYSPGGKGVYMTVVLHPNAPFGSVVSVTTAVSVAVCRAVESLFDIKLSVKWVNDIFVGEKKLCGILTEAVSDFESGTVQSVIIGIGININNDQFPDEIKEIAASLSGEVSRNRLIAAVADEVVRACANLGDKSYIREYRGRSMLLGREIVFFRNGEAVEATAVGIDDEGGLVVSVGGVQQTLKSGEISVRKR